MASAPTNTARNTGAPLDRRNLRTGALALLGALTMLGLGYAAVPLYDLFCRVTGFGGTTQRASETEASAAERIAQSAGGKTMSIRFDASTARDVPWRFTADQPTDTVQIGVRDMAFYTARNNSSIPITGTATFNVEPERAGKYFNKIQCFCFTEQTLQPGQEMRMPVLYYVDPAALDDEAMADVEQITLSYTFHRAKSDGAQVKEDS
ncbi:Cytochrome c oxidase assembly protein COX11, mitochondrial [Alteripontixanthobacter maritimus]|uniref:Cytochrome c oxidase assembly protein CtaG n=1 Tax=Alteripontixanthobacter maritimus TaxID=2161824 RepID=A0A369QBY7_9SPHN|nr:cytochrome c oxidase assembly protein [Alteripontixanthobacter maritimus]RDC60429.1 Cytochrome c oxidase assembly protein COX11, mitochondrial [Alteripontixanthobacter maritimus]